MDDGIEIFKQYIFGVQSKGEPMNTLHRLIIQNPEATLNIVVFGVFPAMLVLGLWCLASQPEGGERE